MTKIGEEQLGQRFPLNISVALNGVGARSKNELNRERNVRLLRNSLGSDSSGSPSPSVLGKFLRPS